MDMNIVTGATYGLTTNIVGIFCPVVQCRFSNVVNTKLLFYYFIEVSE